MSFACIHIPNFIVQAAVRAEPELRLGPIAIVSGKVSPLVVAVNLVAFKAGVEPGMAALQALEVTPLAIRPRALAQEQIAHAALLDLGFSFSPRVEDTDADTIVLDLAGVENLLGSPEEVARRMVERAANLGFEVQVAIAPSPEAAFQAARGIAAVTILPVGEKLDCLGSLPLEVLGPSAEMLETLHRWGIRTLGALAALPDVQLAERLGQEGVQMQARARGTSLRPLVPTRPALQFEEVMELDHPIDELESLAFVFGLLLNRLCARLRARALGLHELLVEMDLDRGADAEQVEGKTARRYEKRLRLPVPSQNAATLLKLLQLRLGAHSPAAPVTRVRIKAEAAKPRSLQAGLFLPGAPDPEKLEVTLARLAKLVGEENVGSPELVDTHRPDGFRMVGFHPFESATDSATRQRTEPTRREPSIAARVFRPPLPAEVETYDGFPVHVFFGRKRCEVVAASGPWRTCGDWWSEDGWQREEWDVELKVERRINDLETVQTSVELGLYRMYRDLRHGDWFVEASYD